MFETIILGIIQGLTEFLPVSSTAHLIFFPWLFNWSSGVNTLSFDVALHAGTLLALISCFYKDWIEMLLHKRKLLLFIIIATIPAGITGLFLHNQIETTFRLPILISAALIIFGIVMLISEKFTGQRNIQDITLKNSLIIGLSQAIALIPGVSRSGITISTGLFMGLRREESARFSFLLSMPVVLGAVLLEGKKLLAAPGNHDAGLFAAGFAISAVFGFIAIKFILKFFEKHTLNVFVYYRFILAALIIGTLWLRRIN